MRSRCRPTIRLGERNPARFGFTLLEVLVVVAVIALLAAILMPSLSQARQQTRRVVCQSNLKQIAAAFEMYFRDSKDWLLRGPNKELNHGGQQGNRSREFGKDPNRPVPKPLNRYVGMPPVTRTGPGVFSCPSDTGTSDIRPTAFSNYGTSYYSNHLLIGQNSIDLPPGEPCEPACGLWTRIKKRIGTLKRSGVQDVSRVLLIGDYTWYDNWDPTVPERFPYWHQTRSMHNFAFVDTHVEFVPIRKGIHVDKRYTLIPFMGELRQAAESCQAEIAHP
jgi:prepilin-type N-terminal cleavage/methylation domain-containing protein